MLQNIISITFLSVGCLGVAINLYVCLIFTKKPIMRTSLSVIFMNLAIADILWCLFSIIMYPFYETPKAAFLGSTMCTFIIFLSSLADSFLPIAIAAPLVIYSFYNEMNVRKCWLLMCSLWLFAILCAIIPAYNAEHFSTPGNDSTCVITWTLTSNINHEICFEIFNVFIHLGLPIIITATCIIAQKITKKSFSDNLIHRMCLRIVIIYMILWTPLVMFFFWMRFFDTHSGIFYQLHLVGYGLAMLSMFYKPILYFIYDPPFTKEFKSLMPFCKSSQAENYDLHSNVNIVE